MNAIAPTVASMTAHSRRSTASSEAQRNHSYAAWRSSSERLMLLEHELARSQANDPSRAADLSRQLKALGDATAALFVQATKDVDSSRKLSKSRQ